MIFEERTLNIYQNRGSRIKGLCGERGEIEKMVFGVFKGDMFIRRDERYFDFYQDSNTLES